MDLTFADYSKLSKQGRNFNCKTCPKPTQKIRRCHEPRENFTYKDGNQWPMSVQKGGPTYGFCPAKATWDQSIASWYNILVIVAETGQLPDGQPLVEQDSDFIDLLAWFIPRYRKYVFAQNAEMIFGTEEQSKGKKVGNKSRPTSKNIRR